MPKNSWSDKRERQYQHIKKGLLDRGKPEELAEEISERAQKGEAKDASATSVNDLSPSRRGGLRLHQGEGGKTLAQLRNEAKSKNIKGRSGMSRAELEKALKR
jgi:hypothetical protein